MKNMEVFQNLVDAGCETNIVEQFFQLQNEGKIKQQFELLRFHRKQLLSQIHASQKCLDRLDYLIYYFKKEVSNKER